MKGSERALSLLNTPVKNVMLGKQTCPSCFKRMQLVFSGAGVTELDTCKKCRLVWFDKGEIRLSEGEQRVLHTPPTISQGKRKHSEWTPPDPPIGFSNPESDINLFVMGMLRIPEEHITPAKSDAHITRLLVILAVLVTLSQGIFKGQFISAMAFYPTDPFKDYGLRWVMSLFAHGGTAHLLGNCYFLWLFGDNVEDFLGSVKFLELFFIAALIGDLTYILFASRLMPSLGASGAISGLGVFYMLNFPHGKLSFLIPYIRVTNKEDQIGAMRFTLPIWVVVGIFLLFELFGSYLQMHNFPGRVNHLCHIGGAVGGAIFWYLFGPSKKLA